jgi:hypothetical protein
MDSHVNSHDTEHFWVSPISLWAGKHDTGDILAAG